MKQHVTCLLSFHHVESKNVSISTVFIDKVIKHAIEYHLEVEIIVSRVL